MNKTRTHKRKSTHQKLKKRPNRRHKKTYKKQDASYVVPEDTYREKNRHSKRLFSLFKERKYDNASYAPTINEELITLQSTERNELYDCNIINAYNLKEPLSIGIPGKLYGKTCFNYNSKEAKKYLLHNLAANKHVDITKIIPPMQIDSNCWFNVFFVIFFISDKGRKFFHFFRELMIKGQQQNGDIIHENLRNAFALLNFGIDAALTGNKFAYELNTNSIIHQLYKSIPKTYRQQNPYIVDVNEAGSPLLYYTSIINYLNNNSIILLLNRNTNNTWKTQLAKSLEKMTHLPHIIVFEVTDKDAPRFNTKPVSFTINEATYMIDSASVRDTSKRHFCATLTCDSKEMAYDGMSFHRIEPFEWKHKMNTDYNWKFEGTQDVDGSYLLWNFTKCYQMLMYYRVS
jgi:hypothetical protein